MAATLIEAQTVRWRPIVYDQLSLDLGGFQERIKPGAFRGSRADTKALFNHDVSKLLGREQNKTLRLMEDAAGILAEVSLPDTTAGKDVATLVARGDLTGGSFAFRIKRDQWLSVGSNIIREVHAAELFDVSLVTTPAYSQTEHAAHDREFRSWSTIGERGRTLRGLERARRALRAAQHHARLLGLPTEKATFELGHYDESGTWHDGRSATLLRFAADMELHTLRAECDGDVRARAFRRTQEAFKTRLRQKIGAS